MPVKNKKNTHSDENTKLCGILIPKPMKVSVGTTVDQWSDIMPLIKAMDDIGVVMPPFGDVVTVILVVNIYVMTIINFSGARHPWP